MKKYGWLAVIVFIAAFLRFWHVTQVPPALNSDEVAIGYNAYSVLTTGKDEYNTRFPILFRSFDDYKMPLYVYLVSGSMKLFGYGDFAVRFPSALFGTLTVLCTYFLVMELFRKKEIALVSSFLLAISPWSLQFSRAGYEANVAVFFVVLGIYLFLKRRYIFSSFVLSLSIWTYLTPRLFVPLLVAGLTVIYWQTIIKHKGRVFIALAVAALMLFPIARMTLSPAGQMRASGVSAFANPDIIKKSTLRLARDSGIVRIFDNRRIVYVLTFLRGYFAHFDPNFLFLDKSIDKYHAPDVGLLYLFELPFILVGAYMLVRRWNKSSAVIFWWVLMAPVAAAFTLQLPHPVRTLVFLPTFQIIGAVGAVTLWQKKRIVSYVLMLCLFVNILFYLHQYFVVLPIEDASSWYVGRKEMVEKINAVKNNYDTVYVSNALDFPYIFYLYYSKYDPVAYQKQGGTLSGGFTEDRNHVENVQFRSISTSLRGLQKKALFVGLPGEVFKKSLIADSISYPDGSPAIEFFR